MADSHIVAENTACGTSPHARSWNDPPILKFDVTASTGKHHLNKRVFSSLNKQELQTDSIQIKDDGKILKEIPSSLTTSNDNVQHDGMKEGSRENCDIPETDVEILNYVTSVFKHILKESSVISERPLKEIDRRISIMEKAWYSSLSKEVKHKMYKMAQELSNGNVDSAEKIHCSLIIQNVREVKNWMVGVKHIIEMRKENQDLQINAE
ncbi:hypothetical protein CDAR_301271 [Caerostris darwini]|uniref:SRA1/Sec31 domain-containing protein n=1 Tax=Caerostris darwini TaxID=1538125 RepID=A0AAV4W0X5_9ARAC|nr:hypothetical protein CDAR_301271 [Caerostris darwini]